MIDSVDIEHLTKIFVTRKECNEINEEIENKLSNMTTENALMNQKLDLITWLGKTTLGTILVAIIGVLLKTIFIE